MSFDIYVRKNQCSHCGRHDGTDGHNVTHNLNEIVERCLVKSGCTLEGLCGSGYKARSWGRFNGHPVKVVLPALVAAREQLLAIENRKEWLDLEPENGWGTWQGLCQVFQDVLIDLETAQPDDTVETSG